jgi:hypothetical protein
MQIIDLQDKDISKTGEKQVLKNAGRTSATSMHTRQKI